MRYFIFVFALLGLFSIAPAFAAQHPVVPAFSETTAAPAPLAILPLQVVNVDAVAPMADPGAPGVPQFDDCSGVAGNDLPCSVTVTPFVGLTGYIICSDVMPFTVTSVSGSTFNCTAVLNSETKHYYGVPNNFIEEDKDYGFIIGSDIQPYGD